MTAARQFHSYSGPAAQRPSRPPVGTHYAATDAATTTDTTNAGGGSAVSECVYQGGGSWISAIVAGGSASGPEGAKYSPDRPPVSIARNENFVGSMSETWTAFNSGESQSWAVDKDTGLLTFTPTSGNNIRGAFLPALPAATDWAFVSKWTALPNATSNAVGFVVLVSGSIATPTKLLFLRHAGDGNLWFTVCNDYAYGGAAPNTSNASFFPSAIGNGNPFIWTAIAYTASSKALVAYQSRNGYDFAPHSQTYTCASDPLNVGVAGSNNSGFSPGASGRYANARLLTGTTTITVGA